MTRRLYGIGVALLLSMTMLVGCGPSATSEPAETPGKVAAPESAGPLNVTVSILPQKYFVERIGGERVNVNVMVEPGDNPATYEPTSEQLKALSGSAAYVSYGAPFEKAWMDRIAAANPEMLIVDTREGIELMPMQAHHHSEESKHEEEQHGGEPENPDPHIFLSPRLVKIQSQTIYDALVQLDPEHKDVYRANLDSFIEDIDVLDEDIRATLEGVQRRKFMVFHPAWGYFARDYDLEMVPIEIGGQEPSPAELAALITEAREDGIKVVFAQPEFSTKAAEVIANEIGGEVLLISPLAPDWLTNMRSVANTLAEVLDQQSTSS